MYVVLSPTLSDFLIWLSRLLKDNALYVRLGSFLDRGTILKTYGRTDGRTDVGMFVRTYVRTYARTHVRTYVRTYVRGIRNAFLEYPSWQEKRRTFVDERSSTTNVRSRISS